MFQSMLDKKHAYSNMNAFMHAYSKSQIGTVAHFAHYLHPAFTFSLFIFTLYAASMGDFSIFSITAKKIQLLERACKNQYD